jgi:hypothetical protein
MTIPKPLTEMTPSSLCATITINRKGFDQQIEKLTTAYANAATLRRTLNVQLELASARYNRATQAWNIL